MAERIQTEMERALRHHDAIVKALRKIADEEASGKHVPRLVKELTEAGIILDRYNPDKNGYPEDRNMI